jgi:hypothetical protein
MAWYWILIIGFVLGGIVGYALVAYAISRGHDFEKKGIRKGDVSPGMFPWWFFPISFMVFPFFLLRNFIEKIQKKGEKDPHDISGEV